MAIPVKMNIPLNNEVYAFVTKSHASLIDQDLLQRFTDVTSREPHRFLRRGIVFSHRDLETILDKYERKEPFYLSPAAAQAVIVYILDTPYLSNSQSMLTICLSEVLALMGELLQMQDRDSLTNFKPHSNTTTKALSSKTPASKLALNISRGSKPKGARYPAERDFVPIALDREVPSLKPPCRMEQKFSFYSTCEAGTSIFTLASATQRYSAVGLGIGRHLAATESSPTHHSQSILPSLDQLPLPTVNVGIAWSSA
ncbi:hypothetical protein K431DRAFT_289849 [Polychaeton citri CBS 116435]|uniref:Tryptophanyl-tRNA synthetase n=1 Tax=Polychaeton citri CBS 116435 TaxID=1314669 RepID=A0A9P4Q032_9PEZI|nr:hypothetical protein K431DRAFT_289849 [Polychaeton citri CBS 116435]